MTYIILLMHISNIYLHTSRTRLYYILNYSDIMGQSPTLCPRQSVRSLSLPAIIDSQVFTLRCSTNVRHKVIKGNPTDLTCLISMGKPVQRIIVQFLFSSKRNHLVFDSPLCYPLCVVWYNCPTSQGEFLYIENR